MEPPAHLRMLIESAAGIAPRTGDLQRIRTLRFREPGFDRETWLKMCEMGWLGLRVAEESGGSCLGTRELCALVEELGAGPVPEPLIPAAMAACLLPADHLAEVLSGKRIILPAWQERSGSLALDGETTLRDGRLTGRKTFVPHRSRCRRIPGDRARWTCADRAGCAGTPPRGATNSGRRARRHADIQQCSRRGARRGRKRRTRTDGPRECRLSSRADGPCVRHHARLPEDPGAIRTEDRELPGASAPIRRPLD